MLHVPQGTATKWGASVKLRNEMKLCRLETCLSCCWKYKIKHWDLRLICYNSKTLPISINVEQLPNPMVLFCKLKIIKVLKIVVRHIMRKRQIFAIHYFVQGRCNSMLLIENWILTFELYFLQCSEPHLVHCIL